MPSTRKAPRPLSENAYRKAAESAFKGAREMRSEGQVIREERERKDTQQEIAQARQKRLERMVRLLPPAEREAVMEYLEKLGEYIDQKQQVLGAKYSHAQIVHHLQKTLTPHIEAFLEDRYPRDPANKRRLEIIIKGLFPEEQEQH